MPDARCSVRSHWHTRWERLHLSGAQWLKTLAVAPRSPQRTFKHGKGVALAPSETLLLQTCWRSSWTRERARTRCPVVSGNLALRSPCSMTAEAGGILDTRNTTGIPITSTLGWDAHLDIAADHTAFMTNAGLDTPSVLVSRTAYALLITRCVGKTLSVVSLVSRRYGLEAWRVLKDE